jgi:hypothetical protein
VIVAAIGREPYGGATTGGLGYEAVMPLRSALLTVLACSALAGCGGDDEGDGRPRDFRAAADEICVRHNERLDEIRQQSTGRQMSVEEAVENLRTEATIKEEQLEDLRGLKPPPAAKGYLDRLERNAAGYREAADEVEATRGRSFEDFLNRMFNSENAARREAEALGLRHCSPAPLN